MDKGEGSLCPFFLYYQGNRLLSRGVCGIDVRVSTVKALYGKGCNLGILLSTGAGRYKELKRAAIRSIPALIITLSWLGMSAYYGSMENQSIVIKIMAATTALVWLAYLILSIVQWYNIKQGE
jgi:hypothetical protein